MHVWLLYCRPQFMAAYFNEPGYSGQKGGPDSDQVGTSNCMEFNFDSLE